jgi:hypothetical protein
VTQPDRKLGAALQQPQFSAIARHLSRIEQGPGNHRRLSGAAASFMMKLSSPLIDYPEAAQNFEATRAS